MSILLKNKILQAAEDKIESQLTPQNRINYLKVVNSGMQAAMAKGPNSILASLKDSKDPLNDCAKGAVNMCLLLRKQSRDTMPIKCMVPAAMTLMLKALDSAQAMGLITIGNDELVQATHIFTNYLMHALGITQPMLATAATKLHAMTQDPGQMEKIKRAAGVVKDPRASTPTPVPQ
jgi:hypothetical protein